MANKTGYNLVRIDTFGSDVVISTGSIKVNAILATGYNTVKTVTFIDVQGEQVMKFEVAANGTSQFTPSKPFTFNGLTFDDSASDFADGDVVYLYLV